MKLNALIFSLLFTVTASSVRVFPKCEVIFELRELGYPEHELKNLACLIEMFRSHKVGLDPYSTYDYELLPINDHFWCNVGPYRGRGCDVSCSDLQSDDITIAASCAKSLLSERNGRGWYIWEIYCRAFKLPDQGC